MSEITLINKFINELNTDSENTKDCYKYSLKRFQKFLMEQDTELTNATNKHINEFIAHRIKSNIKNSAVARDCTAIKNFYKSSSSINKKINPNKIELPFIHKAPPEFLTKDQIYTFLEVLDCRDARHIRDYLLFNLIYYNGLKLSEALNIKWMEITTFNSKYQHRTIFIKERSKWIEVKEPHVVKWLNKYLETYREHFKYEESPYLFISNKSEKLSRKSAWRIMQNYVEENKIKFIITPELIRSSAIVHKLQDGETLDKVKVFAHLTEKYNFERYIKIVGINNKHEKKI